MKKITLSLLAVLFVFASCGGPDAVKFNDAIAKANATITQVSVSYDSDLTSAVNTENYEAIAAKTDSALAKIDAEITIVKALDVPKGGADFKEAALKTYESLRGVVEAGKGFASLTKDSAPEDVSKLQETYQAKVDEYSKSFESLTAAQLEYAKEAGYEVRK
ncbi:hypothetical protein [Prevotella sp. 10(H)]|uniref:hypothetical protein n=1 Tax=Prevotella sp. 10(H) TaxID=1158294 RepID=UPI0004A6ECEB|nr:hypothetical protein [Prevotella sp. 10(H)]